MDIDMKDQDGNNVELIEAYITSDRNKAWVRDSEGNSKVVNLDSLQHERKWKE